MGEFWERNVIEPGKLPPLLALLAFILTFLITRFITRSIRAGRGPFRDNVSTDGTHVHHAVPGIALLVTGAFTAISAQSEPWVAVAAVMIGSGTSLVLDEFALILHLKDVYWTTEGRVSVELVGLAAACLAFVTVGFVPLGVDDVNVAEFGLRFTLTTSYTLNGLMVLTTVLKGKYRAALIGAFVPFAGWVSAIRMARPQSWWARRWYGTRRMERARARDLRFQRRWDPHWYKLSNFIAGRPTPVPGIVVPAAPVAAIVVPATPVPAIVVPAPPEPAIVVPAAPVPPHDDAPARDLENQARVPGQS